METKWCLSWRRRTPFGNGYSKFKLGLVLATLVLISFNLVNGNESGSRASASKIESHYDFDYDNVGNTNLASDAYHHYYADEFTILLNDGSKDPHSNVNFSLRNVTSPAGGQLRNAKEWNGKVPITESSHVIALTPQTLYDSSGAIRFPTSQPALEPVLNSNVNYENHNLAGETVNTVHGTSIWNLSPEDPSPIYHTELLDPFPPHLEDVAHGPESEFGILYDKLHTIQHYLPIISFAAVYLFISILVYLAAISVEGKCEGFGKDILLTDWEYRARRRFIPARSVDPHLQLKLLDLFHGIDEEDDDDSEEFSHIDEAYMDGELSRINTLCPRHAFFFALSPRHVEAYSALKELFLAQDSPEEVISLAKYLLVKEKVHPKVWYIAIVGAKLDRQDMAGFSVAHPLDAIPDWYIPGDLLKGHMGKHGRGGSRVKRYAITRPKSRNMTIIRSEGKGDNEDIPGRNDKFEDHHRKGKGKKKGKKGNGKKEDCITVDGRVGIDNGIENELWYWREDLMLNQHHWYWHQVYPPNSTQHGDRRAELFFYMHRAFIARYNAERLANGMDLISPLPMHRGGIIPEGYNSHLLDVNSGIYWTPRGPQTPLQVCGNLAKWGEDVFHEEDPDLGRNITFDDYSRNHWRLVKAAKSGKLLSEMGGFIPINHAQGIEPLVNTADASDLSVNPMFYDPAGIHTLGHVLIGMAADPDFSFRLVTGIMSEGALSMRDPSFYAFHLFLDNLFEKHKQQLAPYKRLGGNFPLLWKGVEIVNLELHSQGGLPINELRTFWTHHRFELSQGVDGSIKNDHAKVCAQHLDHEPFHFKIVIDRKPCVNSRSGKATVRIFMAPRYDEKGRRIPVKIQRRLMFPLDSFPVKLKIGRNTIIRHAEDSYLTQHWTKSLHELRRGPDPSGSAEFCGCGWPQHLFIPKGTPDGMPFDLFVMITNYDEDYVPIEPELLKVPVTCHSPYIFCGLPRRRYPDRRPMGYPFDRPLSKSLNCPPGSSFFSVLCKALNAVLHKQFYSLEEYASRVPNMAAIQFHIRHLDTFRPEPLGH